MMSDPNNNNNSQTNLANNGSPFQCSTTDTNSAINNNNNDTNVLTNSHLNPIVSVPDNSNINNNNSNINDRFSSLDNSSCLSDHSNTISIASLNVRGINNNTKFNAILDLLSVFRKPKLQKLGLLHNLKTWLLVSGML